MFDFIKGVLVSANDDTVILEVNGIGYKLFVPINLYSKLPDPGKTSILYTTLVVREDSHTLFGFQTSEERNFFERITKISGVGPKLALSILGHLPMDKLAHVVLNQDIAALKQIPGIGKKTAERLMLDLRDKVTANKQAEAYTVPGNEALLALMNLGYSQKVASRAIDQAKKAIQDESDLSGLISEALKNI